MSDWNEQFKSRDHVFHSFAIDMSADCHLFVRVEMVEKCVKTLSSFAQN